MNSINLEELERRITALEDLEAIKKLHQNYINLMDELRYAEVLELFTEDAVVEVRNWGEKIGREQLKEVYIGILAETRGDSRFEGHLAIEPDLNVDGDTAMGSWIVYILFSVPSVQWVQGINKCEYRKENGVWKISRLRFTRTLASDPNEYP